MSDVLARIRVKEEHGIQRFLYPLSVEIGLPTSVDVASLILASEVYFSPPLQVSPIGGGLFRLDFAVSLMPLEEHIFLLQNGAQIDISDPLNLSREANGTLRSKQQRFEIVLGNTGSIEEVVYDEIAHLKRPGAVEGGGDLDNHNYRKGRLTHYETDFRLDDAQVTFGGSTLSAWTEMRGKHPGGYNATLRTEITACKSWAKTTCRMDSPPKTGLRFSIQLATTSQTITYDCGVGGSIYGKLEQEFEKHAMRLSWWRGKEEYAYWSLGTRMLRGKFHGDAYIGVTATEAEFQAQRWFHMIDENKSLAVAITSVPSNWSSLNVYMEQSGLILIDCSTNDAPVDTCDFGVCYHFLNDIPAIAAATNPQSILLPPTVEVLPA